jgi:hypothetical protein
VAIAAPLYAADDPRVKELRTQRIGEAMYFHVKLQPPDDMDLPALTEAALAKPTEWVRRRLAILPRLVARDGKHRDVYFSFPVPLRPQRLDTLEFYGRVEGELPDDFLLVYPNGRSEDWLKKKELFADDVLDLQTTGQAAVTLDFSTARKLPNRRDGSADLEESWANAKVRHFAALEVLTPEFGYYAVAREATARKYHVNADGFLKPPAPEIVRHRLYEMTTGAAALTESLAQQRMLRTRLEPNSKRTVGLSTIRGIDVAEHPWEKMMGGKRPAAEPLAELVPHDNYYVTFHNLRAFLSFGELLDQWGGNIMRAVEVHSRDYHIRERYEKQLCLPSIKLVRQIDPKLIRDTAITGSDLTFREGTDVSVIFHVGDRAAFLKAVEPFVEAARKEFGRQLDEERSEYDGVEIESFTTKLREVSLHRAAVGDFVICSNSRVALERILDTRAGKSKAMAEARDFKYMRTIFNRKEESEDGFAFLSDAFIRRLVGPGMKIREKRRLEALTSLQLATHGALFVAAETGELPASTRELLTESGLRRDELDVPEGPAVTWDGQRGVAVSKVYNTLRFATPLVELPLDAVTPAEEREYATFRENYLRLWRRFFDPMGFRLALDDKQVRLEAYILPLIESSQYNDLRRMTGGDGKKLNLSQLTPNTLAQLFLHLDVGQHENIIGDWFTVRLDDSPLFRKQVELQIRRQLDPSVGNTEEERLFWKLPVTLGLGVRDGDLFATLLHNSWESNNLGDGKQEVKPYRGVDIKSVPVHKKNFLELIRLLKMFVGRENDLLNSLLSFLPDKEAPAMLYQALIGDGYYISLQEDSLKRLIDIEKDKKERKKGETDPLNASFYIAPSATKTVDALQLYLEWESHKQALGNNAVWLALERGGIVSPKATEGERNKAAFRLLGYTPVSPDGAAYRYDPRTDEVNNVRHGSYRRERLHAGLDDDSPLLDLLRQLKSVRTDLRFREDGIHTILTIERPKRDE